MLNMTKQKQPCSKNIWETQIGENVSPKVVRVHLADVAALVRSQGDLDQWAAKKACNIYFKDYNGELKRLSSTYVG